jgi:DNA-binding CsgD family transcriptional regulator
MTLEEQNEKRNTTRAQTARPSDQRPAALKREKQESARSEASDNDSIPHLLDSDPLFDLRAWRRSNPHGLFRNKLKELQNWLYDFLPDAPPQQIQEWLTYYEHRFDTLSRTYPELLAVFHVDPESPQEQEFRFCEMIRPLLRSELARHDTKGAGGASQAGARLTETKSESVGVHDNKAEHTSGPVMAPQAQRGTTRNAKHPKKHDLSRYLDVAHLTDRQYECSSLKWEFELSVSEIARKLHLSRKTVDQHIHSAQAKMRSSGLYEKMRKNLSRVQPGE